MIDSNVVVYFLLRTSPFHRELRPLWRRFDETAAPASWEAQVLSALWLACSEGVLTEEQARRKLDLARALGIRSYPVCGLWREALHHGLRARHPTYDTLFVALAHRLAVPLLTYDSGVLEKFPEVAVPPSAFR